MKYDKSLKNKEDKELYNLLNSCAGPDIKKEIKKLKEEGFDKKNIIDIFRKYHLKDTDKPIVGKLHTKKQEILFKDIAKALLKYFKDGGVGIVYIDDVEIDYDTLINKWKKMSFWFKVEK